MLFGNNLYLIGGIIIAVFVVIAGIYFKYSQDKIQSLSQQLTTAELSAKAEKKKNELLINSQKKLSEINQKALSDERQTREKLKELNKKLAKLPNVNPKKATLLERKINKASQDRVRCIEIATGVQPLKNEENLVCPQLLNK